MRLYTIIISVLAFYVAFPALPHLAAAEEEAGVQYPDTSRFDEWVAELKTEAVSRGISQRIADEALSQVYLLPDVIALDRRQPESRISAEQYLRNAVPDSRVEHAAELLAEHHDELSEASRNYGVPKEVIVALWGVETSFGNNMGDFEIIDALATLAYDGRRSAFFRGELLNALQILDEGHISLEYMTGSWAGAMGQCQFMPSSFLKYAVDGDGDGRKDIWNTHADVFASIANYLASEGWDRTIDWIVSASPRDGGRRIAVGRNESAPYYYVSPNFDVILRWNRSRYFGTAVGLLAQRMGRGELSLNSR